MSEYHRLVWFLCKVINTVVPVKYFVLILKPFISNTAYPPKYRQRLGVSRRER